MLKLTIHTFLQGYTVLVDINGWSVPADAGSLTAIQDIQDFCDCTYPTEPNEQVIILNIFMCIPDMHITTLHGNLSNLRGHVSCPGYVVLIHEHGDQHDARIVWGDYACLASVCLHFLVH